MFKSTQNISQFPVIKLILTKALKSHKVCSLTLMELSQKPITEPCPEKNLLILGN